LTAPGHTRGVLDTSTVILLSRFRDATLLPTEPVITRAYDAMIAATAVASGLPVFTCNPADFAGIDGLEVVAIPHPDAPQRV